MPNVARYEATVNTKTVHQIFFWCRTPFPSRLKKIRKDSLILQRPVKKKIRTINCNRKNRSVECTKLGGGGQYWPAPTATSSYNCFALICHRTVLLRSNVQANNTKPSSTYRRRKTLSRTRMRNANNSDETSTPPHWTHSKSIRHDSTQLSRWPYPTYKKRSSADSRRNSWEARTC